MISFQAFSDELQKISAAKWRELVHAFRKGEGHAGSSPRSVMQHVRELEEAGMEAGEKIHMPSAVAIKEPGALSKIQKGELPESLKGSYRMLAKDYPSFSKLERG